MKTFSVKNWRVVVLYGLAVAGLAIFSLNFIQYAGGDYRVFIKNNAWNGSGDKAAFISTFGASAVRFTFRLSYVISFIGLFWRRRAAVYLCVIAWLGQLVPATIFAIENHISLQASLTSLVSLVIYLILIASIWPILKTGRTVLFCTAGLVGGLIVHTAVFAFLWHSTASARETNDPVKQAAFMRAVEDGDATTVKTMLADGSFHPALRGPKCDFNTICNLISYAVDEKGNVDVLKALQEAGSPVDDGDGSTGDTPLMRALFAHRVDLAEYLAAHGADPYKTNRFGVPEFIVASGDGSPQLLEIMIYLTAATTVNMQQTMPDVMMSEEEAKRNGSASFVKNVTPLMIAGFDGRADLIKTLLAHGADPSLTDERGRRLYDYIAAGQSPQIEEEVRTLINNQPTEKH